MNKAGVLFGLVVLVVAFAQGDGELFLGYITEIGPESVESRQERHKIVARRRAGVPLLVHRGASKHAPENTLEAYSAAMDLGADGVEIDIRRSADGVLYLFHDETLDRLTNGSGKVKELTYYELLRITPSEIYGRSDKESRPPTLAALLVLARERAMLLHLDIKEPGIQNEVAQMLEKMDMWDHIVTVNRRNADRLRPPDAGNERDPEAPYNKVRLISYKGWAPKGDGGDEEIIKAIREWMPKEPGRQMVFCSDPVRAAKAMGKKGCVPKPLPQRLRAWWGPKGIVEK